MPNDIRPNFQQNASRALDDQQLRKNFKFAMGNFILKRKQIFTDKDETEHLRQVGQTDGGLDMG